MKRVTSPDNPAFKALRLLAHSARERRKQGRTVLDGVHLVESYLARSGNPVSLAVSESGLARPEIRRILDRHPGIPAMALSDALFEEAAPVETPGGLLAVVDVPTPAMPQGVRSSCVVLEAVQDAGNVGSMLRSAAAAGIDLALLTPGCAQAWSPKTLRAAMGGHFALTIVEHAEPVRLLQGFPGKIVATGLAASASVFELDLVGPVAWLFGSEGAGLTPALTDLAGERVRIPMPGAVESLNVAAAAAVCLFEQVRQRALAPESQAPERGAHSARNAP
jgi:TrmH family RNA methyltransferase